MSFRKRNPLIAMYITQCLIGFAISAFFVALLLWMNIGNLWGLVSNSTAGLMAVFMLWFFNGIVFAAVQFSIRIMGMAEDNGSGPKAHKTLFQRFNILVPAESKAGKDTSA